MVERLAENLEQNGRRPSKQQHPVHGCKWADEPPLADRRDIAIAESGIIDEGEIEQSIFGSCRADNAVSRSPHENFEYVRDH